MSRAERRGATYRDSGVDIDAGNELVRRIADSVRSTHSPQVLPESHGAFGGFFRLLGPGLYTETLEDPVLVGATDGVGTKLKVAFETERFDTVGIDLVAMCVNDLVVSGARPLFFLDYLATSALEPETLARVVEGVAAGCRQADCALLGGETAEMPGFYGGGEFDLAGFAVGIVDRARILTGARARAGDAVIGLPSSGLHSNGFSLVRRVLLEGKKGALERTPEGLDRPLGEELLTPTRIYVRPLLALLGRHGPESPVHAMAHITGGGLLENIPRVLPDGLGAELDRSRWPVPPIFSLIQREGDVAAEEMDRVFNQGLGFVLVVDEGRADEVSRTLKEAGEKPLRVGRVIEGEGVRFA